MEVSLDKLILGKDPEKVVERVVEREMNKWEFKNESEKRGSHYIGLLIVILSFPFAILMVWLTTR